MITNKELNRRIAKADVVKIAEDRIHNDSRRGLYLTLRTGMTHDLFFIGRDVKTNKDIIEPL